MQQIKKTKKKDLTVYLLEIKWPNKLLGKRKILFFKFFIQKKSLSKKTRINTN